MAAPKLSTINANLKPTAAITVITPETAARWLADCNDHNRPFKPSAIAAYARDMRAGEWVLTGEAIKFAKDGRLLDGQNRLAAVVKSGVTVSMFVIRNLEAVAQDRMDAGAKRSASDVLAMHGHENASLVAATAALAIAVNASASNLTKNTVTHAEIEAFVADHPEIHEMLRFVRRYAKRTDCPPAVVGYTFWRMARLDRAEAEDFWIAAADKVGLRHGDPVVALINRLDDIRRSRERINREAYLSLIFRAWNARRTGRPLMTLRVMSPAGGQVAIPEPK